MRDLSEIRGLLVDLDGVLYVEEQPIDGAVAAIEALRASALPLRFVTNTTTGSRRTILERLQRLGFAVEADELITPAALARQRCEARGHRRLGLIMNEELVEDFDGFERVDSSPDAVVMGDLGDAFGFEILNRAFRMVIDGAELIALQKNRFWRTADGLSLDAGPFVAAVEYAADVEAIVVGKPAAAFFSLVLDGLGVEPDEAAMIGDDVESDVGGALDNGLGGILVRTGKYRPGRAEQAGVEPTATIDSIAELPALLGRA